MSCPDRPGIVASMAQGLLELDANIIDNAQHGDPASGLFCMRTRFDAPFEHSSDVAAALQSRADALAASLHVRREDQPPKVLIMVSKHDHCLIDLLQRWKAGELPVRLAGVVSNHPDLAHLATDAGVPFDHVPVTAATKAEAEQRLRDIVRERDAELIVLARYMQILSDDLTRDMDGRIINIHHSFLPGFKGAKPYHQAWERGVKLIGATAHFVTGDLDEGPIIEQDVTRVHHGVSAEQMVVLGKDIERVVLSRAVKAWAEGRVFLVGHRTVVFP
jgi:formyltetrahydrofolate deformylase